MKLDKFFINSYASREPIFGFGDMSDLIIKMKYSKLKDDGKKETWIEILERNVNGLLWILENHIDHDFKDNELQKIAQSIFDDMFNLRLLPAGRPLANLGRSIVEEKGLGACLYNCAFISFNATETITEAIEYIIDMSMLGVGVGIDVGIKQAPTLYQPINLERNKRIFKVPDTREGWVKAVGLLINSYINPGSYEVYYDYSLIRPAGSLIKGMGGIHPGVEPFEKMLEQIRTILKNNVRADSRVLADICNIIGACVVSGGQRRTALLLLGDPADDKFVSLKDYEANPERKSFGWTSNNSPYANIGMDYDPYTKRIAKGEDLGFVWMENAKHYGRMNGIIDISDENVGGFNPCVEIQLESFELCNLIEINPNNFFDGQKDHSAETIYNAVFVAKVISAIPIHWEKSNEVVQRNRRFGISQSGVVEYLTKVGAKQYVKEMETWYEQTRRADNYVSGRFGVEPSIRRTTIKPSGTISKIMGTTAGVHYATSRYLLRRVRVGKNSGYGEYYKQKGYHVEQDVYDPNTEVISFPIDHGDIKTIDDVTMYDQFNLASLLQKHWADNAVSVTISMKNDEVQYLGNALEMYDSQLKCASFLKIDEVTTLYEQVPEEPITEEQYMEELNYISERRSTHEFKEFLFADANPTEYCSSDRCEIQLFENNLLHK